ncbi:bric-a-brac 2-like 4 [Homarus americanus]|uniref:Bric-a-brac 2-like 4 n=1 Tax=Homarus americanus TaxID=6706 RepID=A0A8J5NBI6_HOMAM|nr:bric-a-brac 2-like 4 [Homarus americanus]
MSEYCLRWNNHRPNLVTVFSELLTSEALVDVTLATDGHYIHAHKLVLSACSVYFKDLFGANPCKHPIVILKDIRIDDLKTVIDFIYRGEVNVSQDRLQDVLRTAESLRIKGLAENPRSYDEMSSHGARFSSSSLGSQVTRQRSSLTDSREQSLSLEGDEEAEPGTPPSSKRRKITASHDSSESLHGEHEETENEDRGRSCEVKDEPLDEHENEKPQTRDVEQESNVNRVADAMLMLQGASQDTGEESNTTPGTSSDSTLTSTHSQVCKGMNVKNHCHSTFQPTNQPSCTHPPSQPTNPPLPPPPTRLLLACLDSGAQGTGTARRREHLLSCCCAWYCCCWSCAAVLLVTVLELSGKASNWALMVGIKLACGSLTSPPGLANLTSRLHTRLPEAGTVWMAQCGQQRLLRLTPGMHNRAWAD